MSSGSSAFADGPVAWTGQGYVHRKSFPVGDFLNPLNEIFAPGVDQKVCPASISAAAEFSTQRRSTPTGGALHWCAIVLSLVDADKTHQLPRSDRRDAL